MELENKCGKMVINIKVIGKMIKWMGMVTLAKKMELLMKAL